MKKIALLVCLVLGSCFGSSAQDVETLHVRGWAAGGSYITWWYLTEVIVYDNVLGSEKHYSSWAGPGKDMDMEIYRPSSSDVSVDVVVYKTNNWSANSISFSWPAGSDYFVQVDNSLYPAKQSEVRANVAKHAVSGFGGAMAGIGIPLGVMFVFRRIFSTTGIAPQSAVE